MKRTALVHHPAFRDHDTGPGHPERSQRLRAILDELETTGTMAELHQITPEPASIESILRVHSRAHVEHIAEQSRSGRHFYEGPDTVGSSATYRAAVLAVGAAQQAVDAVITGGLANAFCAIRPPGHHAEHSQAMGFCFFNNVAIAARHLQDKHQVKKIAILDWDVHHGNGTQNTFYDDPSVFYFSIHQYPHYPGSGRADETGTGVGAGTTLNVPMASGSTDTDYLQALSSRLRPALDKFQPDFILISAGFDAHRLDSLSGMLVTTEGFAEITRHILAMAEEHCNSRVVSLLEGGYDLHALAESVVAHVQELATENR